jgi:hypothetical protein
MDNISFEEGIKTLTINNDENRVIKFCPTDPNLIKRLEESEQKMQEAGQLHSSGKFEDIYEAEKIIKELIDYILGSKCADIIFGKMSPFTPCGGNFLFENVICSITSYIKS